MKIKLLEGDNLIELESVVNIKLKDLISSSYEVIDVRFKPVANAGYVYYYAEIIYK